MKISTPVILAMSALDCAKINDFIAWAVDEMVAGKDSDALAVLAGFDESTSSFEVREYFQKAKRELELSEPAKSTAMHDYTNYLVQSLLEPNSNYRAIVTKLSTLYYSNDHPTHLMEWYQLEDALLDIETNNYPFSYELLYQEDSRKVVKDVARRFLENDQGNAATSDVTPKR